MTITFSEIVKNAPELAALKRQAKNWTNEDESRDYERFKKIISSWVGWDARRGLPDFMYSSHAYTIAILAIVYGRDNV